MEIKVKQPIETIERKGLDVEIIRKKGKANTFSGYLIGKIKILKDNGNFETAQILQELYYKFQEFHPRKLNTVEIIEGWKGKDKPEIFKNFNEDFTIVMHQKDKDGEIKKVEKIVPKENVNRILRWIQTFNQGEQHSCYEVAEILGFKSWKDLWRERKQYFELYYYPIKVLEALGLINYSNKGKISLK